MLGLKGCIGCIYETFDLGMATILYGNFWNDNVHMFIGDEFEKGRLSIKGFGPRVSYNVLYACLIMRCAYGVWGILC